MCAIGLVNFGWTQRNYDSLIVSYERSTSDSLRVLILNEMSSEMSYLDVDSAKSMATAALMLAQNSNFRRGSAISHYNLAITFHIQGAFDSALFNYQQALLNQPREDSMQVARLHNNMGSIYAVRGDYARALDNYQLSLKLRPGDLRGAALIYNNLGIIKLDQEKYDEALDLFNQAATLEKELRQPRGISRTLGNIGLVYLNLKDFASARDYYQEAYDIIAEEPVQCLKMYPASGLASVLVELGELDLAEQYAREAQEEADECGDPVIKVDAREVLGSISQKRGQYALAQSILLEGYRLAEENDLLSGKKELSAALYDYYKSRGDYRQALKYLEINQATKDSIQNEDLTEKLTRLEMSYDFELEKDSLAFIREMDLVQYDAEIERRSSIQRIILVVLGFTLVLALVLFRFYRLKDRSNLQLTEKNNRITDALKTNELLMKEIHHRVKNNLQIVSSLLRIQTHFLDDEKGKKALTDIQNRVLAMALVHQNLYQGAKVSEVSVGEYLKNLTSSLQQSFEDPDEPIDFKYQIEDIAVPADMAVNLGLIANELVTNALKHAFPRGFKDKREISLCLEANEEVISFGVQDNGVGFGHADIGKTPLASGYGWKLVESITKSMQGSVLVKNGVGTKIELTLPRSGEANTDR